MKRRIASILAAFALLCSLAAPALAEGYDVEVSNINGDQTKNNPTNIRLLVMKEDSDPILVKKVTTYHWNDGLGTEKAGSISIIEYEQVNGAWKELQVCGTWKAAGRAYWAIENV